MIDIQTIPCSTLFGWISRAICAAFCNAYFGAPRSEGVGAPTFASILNAKELPACTRGSTELNRHLQLLVLVYRFR